MAINRSNIKLQVTRGNKMKMKKRKKGGSFPDVTGDGETTMKDVLVKRGVLEKKGDKFVVAKKQNGGGLKDDIKKLKQEIKKEVTLVKKLVICKHHLLQKQVKNNIEVQLENL